MNSFIIHCTPAIRLFRINMQWKIKGLNALRLVVCFVIIFQLIISVVGQKIDDPYKILGIHRKATLPEIRKAYRQLAKEWHPDKTEHPNAESKFVEIKQAYELLSDTERRSAYDQYGITNEDDNFYKQRHDYSQYGRFSNDPFEEFFGARFRQDQDIILFHKLSVTTRHFDNNILEKSSETPAVVLFYTDWCFDCVRAAGAWRRIVEALQPIGITVATVHAAHEAGLARRSGLHALPCLALAMDKHLYIYKENINNMAKVLEFIRWRFPYKLVQTVSDSNAQAFLTDWEDNRVKALIFQEQPTLRLRYLVAAYHYRDTVSFGFIDMSGSDSGNITAQFKAERGMDSMVLLKEEGRPVATVATGEIPSQTMHQLIEEQQLLMLPRLSSQRVLEMACPVEWRAARRRLCCVLVVRAGRAAAARRALLPLAGSHAAAPPLQRLRYAYLYMDAQRDLLDVIAPPDSSDVENRVVIIWRREATKMQYEWLNETWPVCEAEQCMDDPGAEEKLNDTRRALEALIKRLLRSTEMLPYEAQVQELAEEGGAGRLWRLAVWACGVAERALSTLHREHALSALTVLMTVALVLLASYMMAYLIRAEEAQVRHKRQESRAQNGSAAGAGTGGAGAPANNNEPAHSAELRLHELRAEKYNGLVRLLKPGCRTIVLVLDAQSRDQLLPKFHKCVWPYRKNKTLYFAYLMVERQLEWFRRVLQLSLGGVELKVNARNCVGTVLALNPHRKYFCIFHAKHPESERAQRRMSRMTRSLGATRLDPEAGAFIGFDEPDSSEEESTPEPSVLLEENLLDGLDNWLDRLFEGTTHRYYINYWPDMTAK